MASPPPPTALLAGVTSPAAADDPVKIYQNPSYSGTSASFSQAGKYVLSAANTVVTAPRSIKIGRGYVVYLYVNNDFTGTYKSYTADQSTLDSSIDSPTTVTVKSIEIIQVTPLAGATFPAPGVPTKIKLCADASCSNDGDTYKSVSLDPGVYNLSTVTTGVSSDQTTSVQVPAGWQVELFDYYNLAGKSITLTDTVNNLGSLNFDNMASSVRVTRIGTPASVPEATPPPAPEELPFWRVDNAGAWWAGVGIVVGILVFLGLIIAMLRRRRTSTPIGG